MSEATSSAGPADSSPVADFMTPHPETIDAHQPLNTAASIMASADIGSLVVMDEDRIHGILTDRDIVVRALAESRDPAETEVGSICSTELQMLSPEASVQEAARLMSEKAVKRLVIADGEKPVGVLALADISHLDQAAPVLEGISDAPPNK